MFFENELDSNNVGYVALTKKESINIQKEWLQLFANRVKEMTGKWVVDRFMWSGFCQGLQPCYKDDKAFEKYEDQFVEDYYVFDESGKHAYLCKSEKYPDFRFIGRDIYLMPKSRLWTMVFSHEMMSFFAEAG